MQFGIAVYDYATERLHKLAHNLPQPPTEEEIKRLNEQDRDLVYMPFTHMLPHTEEAKHCKACQVAIDEAIARAKEQDAHQRRNTTEATEAG